jgi:hypothetical protein
MSSNSTSFDSPPVAVSPVLSPDAPGWHRDFLTMLPSIQRQAAWKFRRFAFERRAEAVQAVVADCARAHERLVARGRAQLASATSLVGFAVRRYHAGRRVGARVRCRDVASPVCQRRRGFTEAAGRRSAASVGGERPRAQSQILCYPRSRPRTPGSGSPFRFSGEAFRKSQTETRLRGEHLTLAIHVRASHRHLGPVRRRTPSSHHAETLWKKLPSRFLHYNEAHYLPNRPARTPELGEDCSTRFNPSPALLRLIVTKSRA